MFLVGYGTIVPKICIYELFKLYYGIQHKILHNPDFLHPFLK
jgi:hypothetical protein